MLSDRCMLFLRSALLITLAAISSIAFGQAGPPVSVTTLSITSSGNTVSTIASHSLITLTAVVTNNGAPVSPGQVNFCDATAASCTNEALLGTAQLTASGSATINLIPLIGSYSYKAVFAGTKTVPGSSSAISPLTVTGTFPTIVTLSSQGSGSPLYAGVVTFRAALFGEPISFRDITNGQLLGTAPLVLTRQLFAIYALPLTTPSPASTTDGVIADFNGDGKPDVATLSGAEFCQEASSQVSILLGTGDEAVTAQPAITVQNACATLATGDFNNDGKADVLVGGLTGGTLLLGNGDGTFTSMQVPAISGSMTVGDFNNDGNADIVSANGTLLLGQGNGSFTSSSVGALTSLAGSSSIARGIVTGDFNNDGKLDLATPVNASSGPFLLVAAGNGDGTFQPATNIPLAGFVLNFSYRDIAIGDFDDDNKLDLVISGVGAFRTLLGDGTGNFTFSGSYPIQPNYNFASNSSSVVSRDFNRDGKSDVAVVTNESDLSIFFSAKGLGSHITFTEAAEQSSGIGESSDVLGLLAGDFNGDGIPDLIAINSDAGDTSNPALANAKSLLASAVFNSDSDATLNPVIPIGIGPHNVTASYAGNATFSAGTSDPIVLIAQPVALTLALTANPTASVYGQQVVLTASLSSTFGINTDGETVTFFNGMTPLGTAKLAGGVAMLNLTSLPVGMNSLTAVYSGDISFAATTSSAITETVTAAIAPTLQPASSSQSISAGGTANYTITATPATGSTFPTTVTFSVSGLPTGATAAFAPSTIAAGAAATPVMLAVQVPAQTAALRTNDLHHNRQGYILPTLAISLLALPLAWKRRSLLRSGYRGIYLLLLSITAFSLAGCGGSSPTTNAPTTSQSKTYTLVVTATAGPVTSTTNLSLIVQ